MFLQLHLTKLSQIQPEALCITLLLKGQISLREVAIRDLTTS